MKLQSRGQSRGNDSGKKSLRQVTRSSTGHRHALCHGRVVTLIVTPAGGLSRSALRLHSVSSVNIATHEPITAVNRDSDTSTIVDVRTSLAFTTVLTSKNSLQNHAATFRHCPSFTDQRYSYLPRNPSSTTDCLSSSQPNQRWEDPQGEGACLGGECVCR